MGWHGWIAALGGLVSIIGAFTVLVDWMTWVGGIVAIIFGIWAAVAK